MRIVAPGEANRRMAECARGIRSTEGQGTVGAYGFCLLVGLCWLHALDSALYAATRVEAMGMRGFERRLA